ncbi:MAG: hypothetical protein HY760_01220 [Nitrospirae bacterium]|nr:hypothetical protein [Nitrospirota bacterium]
MNDQGSGWLFDLYPEGNGVRLWFLREAGPPVSFHDPYFPTFYARTTPAALEKVLRKTPFRKAPLTITPVERMEFQSGKPIPVLEVRVEDSVRYAPLVHALDQGSGGTLELFTCDIPIAQRYAWDRDLFPLAFCAWESDPDGGLRAIEVRDDPWSLDYRIPPLGILELRMEGPPVNPRHWPRHGRRGRLEVVRDGEVRTLEGDDPRELLETLAGILRQADPDLILTRWGDSWLLPMLHRMERQCDVILPWHRDPEADRDPRMMRRGGKSYLSYGRIVRREESHYLAGRWHLDLQNSFTLRECGLEGLLELARLGRMPVQPMARSTTGTVITAMQLHQAHQEGILIPWRKQEPEGFKTAEELIAADKGGLIFLPEPGTYGDVAELDFASLYPTIMAKYNISPETLDCPCCPEHTVPEIGRHTCTRREGLVPRVLKPILRKRARYKAVLKDEALSAETRLRFERQQTALKWILVVCFGYMGYRNARFGRIEAHEAVTAYGRELLLQAKETAEAEGYRLIHAIVDSVWVTKPGITEESAQTLADDITKQTGIPMNLEGVYRWLIFPPSRTHSHLAVSNRYVGVFRNGKIKVRGIEMRRRDTPSFIARAQEAIIEVLARAESPAELKRYLPEALEVLRGYAAELMEGRVPPEELAITKHLTQRPEEYTRAGDTAIVAQSLLSRGIRLAPGEGVQMVITSAGDRDPASRVRPLTLNAVDPGYDREKYLELLMRAAETVLGAFDVFSPLHAIFPITLAERESR